MSAAVQKHKVGGDRPTVLLMAGGFGVGPIERMFDAAIEVQTPLDLIVVCGKNAKLKAKLEKVDTPERHRVQVMGFTKEMDGLLRHRRPDREQAGRAHDLRVPRPRRADGDCESDPGAGKPQQRLLLEHGAAIKINSLAAMTYKLDELLGNKPRLATLARNARHRQAARGSGDL